MTGLMQRLRALMTRFRHARRIFCSFCKYWYRCIVKSSACVLDIEQSRACIDLQYILLDLLCMLPSVKQLPRGTDVASELDNTAVLLGVLLNFRHSVMLVNECFHYI